MLIQAEYLGELALHNPLVKQRFNNSRLQSNGQSLALAANNRSQQIEWLKSQQVPGLILRRSHQIGPQPTLTPFMFAPHRVAGSASIYTDSQLSRIWGKLPTSPAAAAGNQSLVFLQLLQRSMYLGTTLWRASQHRHKQPNPDVRATIC
jgi:hypothetical protein